MNKAIFCWSGGKDSSLALNDIIIKGETEIAALLTTITGDYDRISMHGVRTALLDEQSRLLGLNLEKVIISAGASNDEYESGMKKILLRYRNAGVDQVIFGDIFLEDLRAYREANLAKLDMKAVFPLWNQPTDQHARRFIGSGFKAVLTCVDTEKLDASFTGREYNNSMLDDLPVGVDMCGENGEFHTFVYAAPFFKKPIGFIKGETVLRDNRFSFCDLIPQ